MNLMRSPCAPIRFSDLCRKEVINVCDGCRLGYISDVEIDTMCGRINCVFVPEKCKLFSKPKLLAIKWEQIERIGADMVLVSLKRT